VPLRSDVNLVRPAREEGDVGRERSVLDNYSASVQLLFRQNVAEKTSPRSLLMRARFVQLFLYARRHERVGVNLPVRVMKRDADGLALVLEDEDALDEGERA